MCCLRLAGAASIWSQAGEHIETRLRDTSSSVLQGISRAFHGCMCDAEGMSSAVVPIDQAVPFFSNILLAALAAVLDS